MLSVKISPVKFLDLNEVYPAIRTSPVKKLRCIVVIPQTIEHVDVHKSKTVEVS